MGCTFFCGEKEIGSYMAWNTVYKYEYFLSCVKEATKVEQEKIGNIKNPKFYTFNTLLT